MIVRRSCARVLMGLIASLVLTAWPASAQDPITRAKTLYESADYDQALAVLDQLKSDPLAESVPDVAAYRVFCLLALGRSAEANENIAAILRRDPRYQPSETDASPRIRAVFQDVRRRLLPQLFQERYEAAKTAFERKEYSSASDQFKMLLTLVDDPAVAGEDSRRDLRMLISGFGEIAQAAVKAQTPAPAPAAVPGAPPARGSSIPAPLAGAAPPSRGAPVPTIPVYGADDADVTPPVALSKTVPPFRPTGPDAIRQFTGLLEVIVNEQGNVADAKIQKSVYPTFDSKLVAAAHQWKFRPATKDGQPVRYRTLVEVKLVP